MYATIAQARAAGATGTDAQVTAALADARLRIDAYTTAWWEPTPATIVARVSRGIAVLPYRVIAVTAVESVAAPGTALPASGYLVTSSSTPGQIDSVRFGSAAGSYGDPLVVGAEPWAGGWSNLFTELSLRQASIVGTFGTAVTPAVVTASAAALAAQSTTDPASLIIGGGGAPMPPDTDDEGNAVSITLTTVDADAVPRVRSTGNEAVDAALAPYVSQLIRIG